MKKLIGVKDLVVEGCRFEELPDTTQKLTVRVRPAKHKECRCSVCGKRIPRYDRADNLRTWRALDFGGILVDLEYDNYDAIEVSKTKDIPIDYPGVMGVPITWLDKYNPDEFEIIELGNSRDNFTPNKDYINPKKHTKDGRVVNGGAINCVLAISQKEKPYGVVYYTSDNSDYLVPPYARILIRNRNPIRREDDKGY